MALWRSVRDRNLNDLTLALHSDIGMRRQVHLRIFDVSVPVNFLQVKLVNSIVLDGIATQYANEDVARTLEPEQITGNTLEPILGEG